MTAGTIAPTVRAHDHEMTSPRPLATVITPLPRKAEYHIMNLGAGSQSSLLKELFDAGEILDLQGQPIRLDASICADTGEEPAAVYKHLQWLIDRPGSSPIVIVQAGRLGDDLMRGQSCRGHTYEIEGRDRFASLPAYTTNRDYAEELLPLVDSMDIGELVSRMEFFSRTVSKRQGDEEETWFVDDEDEREEQVRYSAALFARWKPYAERGERLWCKKTILENIQFGMTQRQCSKEYKVEPIEQAIRRLLGCTEGQSIPKGIVVHQYIGMSAEELGRSRRVAKRFAKKKWCHVRFPLVENGIYREAAKRILRERFGLPWEAPRSACVCCPYHDHEEWYRIFTVPEDWERAVQIDRALRAPGSIAARGLVQKLYLHRSCRPLESLDLAALLRADRNDRQADIFAGNVGFRGNCEGVCGT